MPPQNISHVDGEEIEGLPPVQIEPLAYTKTSVVRPKMKMLLYLIGNIPIIEVECEFKLKRPWVSNLELIQPSGWI